jgi:phenylpyruvate tautomerase PptA (4-oxalocrotonate tautomerase family)
MIDRANNLPDLQDGARLNRRAVLVTAVVAAGSAAGISPALTDSASSANYGAPLVELQVPTGVLTLEQKAAMIKGITDVVLSAMKQPADPARRLFVQIIETAEDGFGVNGQVFVPRGK